MDLNNLEKYFNMSQVQSGRKDKSDEKMVDKGKDNDLIEDLKFNINRANEIVRLYEKQKNYYLKLNIALITISSIIYGILLNSFNDWGIFFLTIAILIFFAISAGNFIYCTIGNKTNGIKPNLCFYNGYSCQKIKDFSKDSVLGDLKTQICNLHRYQKNYNRIAVKARIITLIGIITLIVLYALSFLGNYIAILCNP